MRIIKFFLFAVLIILHASCKKDAEDNINDPPGEEPTIQTFTGKAQKGPYISGTTVQLYELNGSLGQTGISFTSTVTADDGSYTFGNIHFGSVYGLVTANGFFFSEVYGKVSTSALSLQAISDLSYRELVNINVMTHMIRGRIETLVSNGSSFSEANEQAKAELLAFLGVADLFDEDFESLDISENEDYNAVLLAFSIILQRHIIFEENAINGLAAELSYLLSRLSTDFAPDGRISEQDLLDTLNYNIAQLNLIDIRNNLEERYASLGQSQVIPEFEDYIAAYQGIHSDSLYEDFFFPPESSPDPVNAPNSTVANLLVKADTVAEASGAPYTLAAITPLYASLKIEVMYNNPGTIIGIGGGFYGWKFNSDENGFTLLSQRQNELMTMHLYFYQSGDITVNYYENGAETPSFSKQIHW